MSEIWKTGTPRHETHRGNYWECAIYQDGELQRDTLAVAYGSTSEEAQQRADRIAAFANINTKHPDTCPCWNCT